MVTHSEEEWASFVHRHPDMEIYHRKKDILRFSLGGYILPPPVNVYPCLILSRLSANFEFECVHWIFINSKVVKAVTTNIDKSIDCKHEFSVAYLHIRGELSNIIHI